MNEALRLIKGYRWTLLGVFVLSLVLGLIFAPEALKWSLSLLIGLVVSLLMVLHIGRSAEFALLMPPERAGRYMSSQYFIRMIIYGITLFLSLRYETLTTLAVVLGLSQFKLAVLVQNLFDLWKGGST